ncbi:MAG: RimK family alpha-L-glutamate ligase [Desulfotignum sp.]|nr:RimK family alpha-L-glutamate ligase [Desulfotignum sp.]MCF8126180.1 RimK family alpha-L-glutamate ligase [Desulfotignum sp.]
MNIGILTIHDLAFHPNGRLCEAAQKRGHTLVLINPYQVTCTLEKQFPGMDGSGIKDAVNGTLPDVVLPRQGSPMGEYGFVLLRQFHAMGIPLVNSLKGVTIARHQYITLQALAAAGIPVPDTCFVTRPENFFDAVVRLGGYPVIAKQPSGMGGDGVVKIDDDVQALACVETLLDPVKGLLIQRFFPPKGRVDVRILVIGSRVAGAMKLLPAPDDFRTNIHQNSRATAVDPPKEWSDMAVAAAEACFLDIAGIDMMVEKEGVPHVVEVNYSPGFRGMEAATGIDIAAKIIDHAAGLSGLKSWSGQKNIKR